MFSHIPKTIQECLVTCVRSPNLFIRPLLMLTGLSFCLVAAESSESKVLTRQQDAPPHVRMRDNTSSSELGERPKSDKSTGTKDQLPGRGDTSVEEKVKLGKYESLNRVYLEARERQKVLKSKSNPTSPRDRDDSAKDTLNSAPPKAEGPKPKASEPAAPSFLEKLFSNLRKSGPDPKKAPGPNPEIRRKSYQPSTSDDILK
jgi:hypothetical protein